MDPITNDVVANKKKQQLKDKKVKITNEIMELRKKKALYNECLDLAYSNKSYAHLSKEDPIRLVNNLYSTNKKISNLRDKVDEINNKLYKQELVNKIWAY